MGGNRSILIRAMAGTARATPVPAGLQHKSQPDSIHSKSVTKRTPPHFYRASLLGADQLKSSTGYYFESRRMLSVESAADSIFAVSGGFRTMIGDTIARLVG